MKRLIAVLPPKQYSISYVWHDDIFERTAFYAVSLGFFFAMLG